jgi:hypothetical protein
LITDTQLPIFDGYALCEVLRRDAMTCGVPIIVVTSEPGPTELDRARDAGADAVLIKPVSPEALLNEIQRLLRRPETPAGQTATASRASARPLIERRRKPLAKAYTRFDTKTPPSQPPDLVCPSCDRPLVYEGSHVGGVSSSLPEQWDDYASPAPCGTFVYRQRTRHLRRTL